MKTMQILSATGIVLLSAAIIFTACQKSSTGTSANSISAQDVTALQTSATADDETDNIYNDVTTNVLGVNDDAGIGAGVGVFFATPNQSNGTTVNQFGNGEDSVGRCYTVTIDPVRVGAFPKTITIDFGSGCTGRDGHVRRGKIITVYTGHMTDAGSKATTSFDGFYFDSVKVEGSFSIQNNSTTAALSFTTIVTNGKLTTPSGDYIEINRNHTWTQTAGMDTPHNPLDDVFSITGSSSGTAQVAGTTTQWTTNITQPVIRKLTCRWRVAGQVTITRNDKTAVLDYGNGDCDNKATITINSRVYNITLR